MLMIGTIRRPMRGLLVMSVALALAAAACGGGGKPAKSRRGRACQVSEGVVAEWRFPEHGHRQQPGQAGQLPVHRDHVWQLFWRRRRAATVAVPRSRETVINQQSRKLWINYAGAQFIVIGDQQWVSSDGTS